MSAPLADQHVKSLIETILTIARANPDQTVKEVFGENLYAPHQGLYGQRTLDNIKKWLLSTKIPVIMGFDLIENQMPCISVVLSGTSPIQEYLGDEGLSMDEDLGFQEKEVLVPSFQAKGLTPVLAPDGSIDHYVLILPDSMSFEQSQLFIPGLSLRDAQNREYVLSSNDAGDILVLQGSESAPLAQIALTSFQVVSPVIQARYSGGSMRYQENLTIGIFGHSSRAEGLWLYSLIMWGLLRYRPMMEATYGLSLSLPSASDYSKDDSYLGENIWRRFISLTTTTLWTWSGARRQDVLGYTLSVTDGRVNND